MDVKRIMPHLIPTRGKIAQLVSNILILEQQLNSVEKQSTYFRWAWDSHRKRHTDLLDQYESVRQEFNETSLDELVTDVANNKEYLRQKSNMQPLIARSLVRHFTLDRISKTTEFITLKSFTDVLPEFKVMREDAEILRDILPADKPLW